VCSGTWSGAQVNLHGSAHLGQNGNNVRFESSGKVGDGDVDDAGALTFEKLLHRVCGGLHLCRRVLVVTRHDADAKTSQVSVPVRRKGERGWLREVVRWRGDYRVHARV
jgi:hypothetical protein